MSQQEELDAWKRKAIAEAENRCAIQANQFLNMGFTFDDLMKVHPYGAPWKAEVVLRQSHDPEHPANAKRS